jgi:hypothetical protein
MLQRRERSRALPEIDVKYREFEHRVSALNYVATSMASVI